MTAPAVPAGESQRRLGGLVAGLVPPLNPARFDEWVAQVLAIIFDGARAASGLAARDYTEKRSRAGVPGRPRPVLAEPPELEKVNASMRWAAYAPGEADARTRAAGAAHRMTMDAGRETTLVTAASDPVTTRVARVPQPGACAFCLMLATRGAVYHSTSSAGRDANTGFVGTGEYKFHDYCSCTVDVVWGDDEYEPPEHVTEAERLYEASTGDVSGGDKMTEFRRALTAQRAAASPGG